MHIYVRCEGCFNPYQFFLLFLIAPKIEGWSDVCVCVCVCVCVFSCVQLLVTPWSVVHQAPLSMEFSRQAYWGGLVFPSPGNLSHHRLNLHLLSWQADSLPPVPPWSQFSSVTQSCLTLCDHGLPCPSPMPGACSDSHESIELMMPANHLILCRPLLLLPSIFPSIRVFSNDQFFASGGQSIGVSA